MTQAQLAAAIGTQAPNVSSIERGLRGVSLQQVLKLSKALRINPEEILGGGRPGRSRASTLSPRLARRIERIQALSRTKQQSLLDWLDAYLDKHAGNGHRS
jgi:transcriptional regulator with XRE-family HTH domain